MIELHSTTALTLNEFLKSMQTPPIKPLSPHHLCGEYAIVTQFADPHADPHWSKKTRTFFFLLQPSLTTFLKATEPWQKTSLPSGISRP